MINEYTVDYHPSPSELTERIQPQTFLWNQNGVYLSRMSLEFSLKPAYPNIVAEKFQIMVLRLLENKFVS